MQPILLNIGLLLKPVLSTKVNIMKQKGSYNVSHPDGLLSTVNVRLPETVNEEIKKVCIKHDISVSAFGRKAFIAYLKFIKEKESIYEQ